MGGEHQDHDLGGPDRAGDRFLKVLAGRDIPGRDPAREPALLDRLADRFRRLSVIAGETEEDRCAHRCLRIELTGRMSVE